MHDVDIEIVVRDGASMTSRVELHRRIRAAFRAQETYAVLPHGTWSAGGCWISAKALAHVLGGDLWAVLSLGLGSGTHDDVQHVVLRLPSGDFVDGDGIQTERELLRKMRRVERLRVPYLARFDDSLQRRARRHSVICPARAVAHVEQVLRQRLLP